MPKKSTAELRNSKLEPGIYFESYEVKAVNYHSYLVYRPADGSQIQIIGGGPIRLGRFLFAPDNLLSVYTGNFQSLNGAFGQNNELIQRDNYINGGRAVRYINKLDIPPNQLETAWLTMNNAVVDAPVNLLGSSIGGTISTGHLLVYDGFNPFGSQNSNSVTDTALNGWGISFENAIPAELSKGNFPGSGNVLGLPDKKYKTVSDFETFPTNVECFTAGTPITMADGTTKPIEQIGIGDEVMAFDTGEQGGLGPLRAGRVSKTFVNHGKEVIDFHGMKVTPGHKFLSGDGRFHLVEEVLEMDGSIIQQDGAEIRARTGHRVGSPEDRVIPVGYLGEAEQIKIVYMRAGTPCARKDAEPGKIYSILGMMNDMGYRLQPDGKFTNGEGPAITAFWHWGVPDERHIVITGDDRATMVDEESFRASTDANPAQPKLNRKQRRRLNAGKKRPFADVTWEQHEAPTQYGIFCDGVH